MEIFFKRMLTNELLTTYLPSFLLLLIVYATTFFKQFFFEAALTVNLTVMLVITTLFIRQESYHYHQLFYRICFSVMAKLPPTAYVRMVDIWLIFGQLIPFLEVMLLTAKEHYNDAEVINHHGKPRNIASQQTQVRSQYKFVRHCVKKGGGGKVEVPSSGVVSNGSF